MLSFEEDDTNGHSAAGANYGIFRALFKGRVAEFELRLMRQRAREAFELKVRRDHFLWQPPKDFIRMEDQRIEKSPDRQVQEAITGLFRKFREMGTARRTMLWVLC